MILATKLDTNLQNEVTYIYHNGIKFAHLQFVCGSFYLRGLPLQMPAQSCVGIWLCIGFKRSPDANTCTLGICVDYTMWWCSWTCSKNYTSSENNLPRHMQHQIVASLGHLQTCPLQHGGKCFNNGWVEQFQKVMGFHTREHVNDILSIFFDMNHNHGLLVDMLQEIGTLIIKKNMCCKIVQPGSGCYLTWSIDHLNILTYRAALRIFWGSSNRQ